MTYHGWTMCKVESMNTITVKADPDATDCFASAVREIVGEYPDLSGYDLDPQWADDDREAVVLTLPKWFDVDARRAARKAEIESQILKMRTEYESVPVATRAQDAVHHAIRQSLRQNEIVTLDASDADVTEIRTAIEAECDDSADRPHGDETEYWGTDEHNNDWKVVVRGR